MTVIPATAMQCDHPGCSRWTALDRPNAGDKIRETARTWGWESTETGYDLCPDTWPEGPHVNHPDYLRFYAGRHLQGNPRHPNLDLAPTDRAEVLLAAFRYALGRSTGAASDVARALIAVGALLATGQRAQVAADIRTAIRDGRAGMDCDVAEWRRAADALERKDRP